MRISDWSSDVCSSDLRCVERLVDRKLAGQPVFELRPEVDLVGEALVVDDDEQVEVRAIPFGGMRLVDPAAAGIAADRKGVVGGKRVQVREDCGGGRIIKKKRKAEEHGEEMKKK